MLKAIIFDLDGTLLNTLEDIADCTNLVMTKNNFPISDLKKYNYFVGNGIEDMVRSALPKSERKKERIVKKCTSQFADIYEDGWHNKTTIYDGISDLIDYINSQELKLAILSNKPDNFTKKTIDYFFDGIEFDAVWGKKEKYLLKPNPESALAMIRELEVKSEEVLYVGDTKIDMKTANNCGFCSVGVLWGFRTENELQENGADYIVNSPSDIIEIIKEFSK
ncbi:MAG: HAD family hydrolase [Candidatus Cloacimonadota bacterium]|nr:HAD family hydrolase [Candidatus Cloacimonadota bacterium]